jgi:hypothetical protein
MSGHKQHKKAGQRKEKKAHARQQAFEQPIVGSVTRQRAQDVSNLTDGEISGASWKEKIRGRG